MKGASKGMTNNTKGKKRPSHPPLLTIRFIISLVSFTRFFIFVIWAPRIPPISSMAPAISSSKNCESVLFHFLPVSTGSVRSRGDGRGRESGEKKRERDRDLEKKVVFVLERCVRQGGGLAVVGQRGGCVWTLLTGLCGHGWRREDRWRRCWRPRAFWCCVL
jgi:hypothetical protein